MSNREGAIRPEGTHGAAGPFKVLPISPKTAAHNAGTIERSTPNNHLRVAR
jgi:hypothetical protein